MKGKGVGALSNYLEYKSITVATSWEGAWLKQKPKQTNRAMENYQIITINQLI